MTPEENNEAPHPFSSFVRARIAWHTDQKVPTFEELGLDDACQAAFSWQSNRNNAEFFAFFWLNEHGRAFVREIHGLLGSSGELVLSSIEAAVEIEVTRRVMQTATSVDDTTERVNRAAQWRAIRFFAEAQANNLMVFGHGVANLVLRTLALQPEFQPQSVKGIDPDVFQAGADERGVWCSLTGNAVSEMRRGARQTPSDSGPLLDSLAVLWTILEPLWSVRGMHYHRWRGESPGVTGVNFVNPNERVEEDGVISRTLRLQTEYVEGETIVNDLASSTDSALRGVGAWMPSFLEVWSGLFAECKELNEHAAQRAVRDDV